MNSVVVYRHGGSTADSFVGSGSGGGGVDDILRRLGNVETDVSELRAEVRAISATMPHLATKADLKAEIGEVRAEIGSVRTEIASVRVEVQSVRVEVADVKTKVASMETAIIKWMVATVLTTAGVAFSIAKFVH
jgi:hypothetical protein